MTQVEERSLDRIWGRVVAKAWDDPSFESRLLADPREVCGEEGIVIPAGVNVKVARDDQITPTEGVFCLPYPPKPAEELDDTSLDAVSGGTEMLSRGRLSTPRAGELQLYLRGRFEALNVELSGLLVQP